MSELQYVAEVIRRVDLLSNLNQTVFNTDVIKRKMKQLNTIQNERVKTQRTLEIHNIGQNMLNILKKPNIKTYLSTLKSINDSSELSGMFQTYNQTTQSLEFANALVQSSTKSTSNIRVTLIYDKKCKITVNSSVDISPITFERPIHSNVTLSRKLKRYISTDAKLCVGLQSFYQQYTNYNGNMMTVDKQLKSIFSKTCCIVQSESNPTKKNKKKKKIKNVCMQCSDLYKRLYSRATTAPKLKKSSGIPPEQPTKRPTTRSMTKLKKNRRFMPETTRESISLFHVNDCSNINNVATSIFESCDEEEIKQEIDVAMQIVQQEQAVDNEYDIVHCEIDKKRAHSDARNDLEDEEYQPPIKKKKLSSKQNEPAIFAGIKHKNMNRDELIKKINMLQTHRLKQAKKIKKLEKENARYRKSLRMDELKADNEWHNTFQLYIDHFEEFEEMAEKNPLRAEFDFDQARNRLMTHAEKPNQCRYRRASQLFFIQVFQRPQYFKHIKWLDYLIMPCITTMRKWVNVTNHGPGMSLPLLRVYEEFQEEYWDFHDIPPEQRVPFLVIAHDASNQTAGIRYSATSKKLYGITSSVQQDLQIKSVFELYRGVNKISAMKYGTQTLLIDLNSGFEHVFCWWVTEKEMDGNYLFDVHMSINEYFVLNCKFGAVFHGWINDGGTNNQNFYKNLFKRKKLYDIKVMMIANPLALGQKLGLFWDNTHVGKNVKKGLWSSRLENSNRLSINGKCAVWNVIEICWDINQNDILNLRPVTFRGLTKNCVELTNSWCHQKWPYVLVLLTDHFRSELRAFIESKDPRFVGAESTLLLLEHLATFVELCISPARSDNLYIENMDNVCFTQMKEELNWWYGWKNNVNDTCLAPITMATVIQFYETFPVFAKYYFDMNERRGVIGYLCVYRLTQNKVESLFGQLKSLGGGLGSIFGTIMNKLKHALQLKKLGRRHLTNKMKHYAIQKSLKRDVYN